MREYFNVTWKRTGCGGRRQSYNENVREKDFNGPKRGVPGEMRLGGCRPPEAVFLLDKTSKICCRRASIDNECFSCFVTRVLPSSSADTTVSNSQASHRQTLHIQRAAGLLWKSTKVLLLVVCLRFLPGCWIWPEILRHFA